MSPGSSPGSRNTGTRMRETLPSPGSWRSARPMIWTISTGEERVSAKTTACTPRLPLMSTPSPRTRQLARNDSSVTHPSASSPSA